MSEPVNGPLIGRSARRLEDKDLLTGQARFVDDLYFPDCLHIAFARSAYAHARIASVDVAAARALAGVHAVWTAADLAPHWRENALRTALPSPAFRLDLHRPVLADNETAHVGEAIVAVVADSRYIAEDAVALLGIDYEPLPAVADCRDAVKVDSPTAHSGAAHNIAAQFTMAFGDCEAAFAKADHIFRESFAQHRGAALSLEGRGALAWLNPHDDVLTLWSSTQTPHQARGLLCELLSRDQDRVRVVAPAVGGGFGPKLVFYPEEAVAALGALILRRPVKWIEDRKEHFIATTQERDQFWDMEIALDSSGGILGVRGALLHDHGAYSARGVNVPYGSASAVTLPYIVPAYKLDVTLAVTNKVPVTPIRGAGQPQGVFVMERLLDRAARELGLDRAAIRLRNLVPAQSMPFKTPMKTRGGMQIVLDSGDYPAALKSALARIDWAGFGARKNAARRRRRRRGIGLANYVEGTGRGPFESVRVRIGGNGRIHVASGAVAIGQGAQTMLAQIVADQLGGDIDNISVALGDTAIVDLGIGAFNSRQTVMAGSSAHAAAAKVRKKLLRVASQILDVGEQALDVVGRRVQLRGDDSVGLDFGVAARAAAGMPGYFLPGDGEPGLEATESVIINEMAYGAGACAVEVSVEAETGEIRIEKVVFVHDCGKAVNPQLVDGQIMGGLAHGIGNALFERMAFDDDAQPISTTLAEYLLVTATEMPRAIEIAHHEIPSPLNELGLKGVGESGVIPMTAAIASAIDDALDEFGCFIRSTPVAPSDIIAILAQARK